MREHAEGMLAVGVPLAQEYLEGRHPQQDEVHLRSLTFDYLYRWALFNARGRSAPRPSCAAGATSSRARATAAARSSASGRPFQRRRDKRSSGLKSRRWSAGGGSVTTVVSR